jgi:hypothetical protein
MIKKIVLMTHPGTFNYGNFSVVQPRESFTDIEGLYTGLPVQVSHDEDAKTIGKVLSAKTSVSGHTYGLLELNDETDYTSVSLGYYVDTTEIRNSSASLVGKITPYHLALTNTPRKKDCCFNLLPTPTQLLDLLNMETNFLDLLTLFLTASAALEDATEVSALTIVEAADGQNTAVDIFLGEVATYLQEGGATPATDPHELLMQLAQARQDSVVTSSYTPGMLQKQVKDALVITTKPVVQVSTQYKNQNKTVILK